MKTSLLLLFLLSSFFVRSLRWLGILQQKEYRLDRLLLFLRSSEGFKELFRFIPKRKDFSRTGLKRPKFTKRSFLVALIFLLVSFFYFKFGIILGLSYMLNWYPYQLWYKFAYFVLLSIIYLVFIPVFVITSNIPTIFIAALQTYKRLFQASKKINSSKTKVIGITGSYGKTSTKILLKHVLETNYSVFMTPKSYNTKYSVANSIVNGFNEEEIAIIEYAAYKKGEIKKLTNWIKPSMAIITGLTQQHLGLFGKLQDIIESKSELVASLPKKSKVICNTYDVQTKQIFEHGSKINQAELIAISPEYKKVKLENVRINEEGKLQFSWNNFQVKTQLIGAHYIEVIHLVIVTSLDLGLKKEDIVRALESFSPEEKFVYSYTLTNGARVVDDGDTSNPKGFEAMINLAKKIKADKKILVASGIVDLGKESSNIHTALATKARKSFNTVVYVGDAGKEDFKQVFTEDLLTTDLQLQEIITSLSSNDLIILEGRIPAWAQEYLR
jgi:UDP-N-acetylmuramoyl-tripeptide--D-alanyl-D-alanine ligase